MKKIIVAGGGTGGHIYPALATIEALQQSGQFRFQYIGGYQGLEKEIVPASGIPFKQITISGFHRYFTWKNLLFPVKLIAGLLKSFYLISKFKPDVVVGTGGYVSGPVVFAAAKMGIPTLIEEQDQFPGVTTRILLKYADVVCVPADSAKNHLKQLKGELLVSGNPIRQSLNLRPKSEAVGKYKFSTEKPVLFILGGSQGAHSINEAVKQIIAQLISDFNLQVIWQCGRADYENIFAEPALKHDNLRIFPFIDDMENAYSAADIIVSRAGAISLAELSFAEKPCILIPYPHAAADHQLHNAEAIANAGAAILVKDNAGLVGDLRKALEKLLENVKFAGQMGQNWRALQKPDAANIIAKKIIQIMKK